MPAVVFTARSVTELLSIRARDQADEPYIYTGGGKETGITSGLPTELRSLTYVFNHIHDQVIPDS